MSDTVIVGLLAFLGTVIGSVVSIITSNRLTNYKLDELKKTVEKHNSLIERTFRLEEHSAITDSRLGTIDQRLDRLEEKV